MENKNVVVREVLKDIRAALTQYRKQIVEAFDAEKSALNYIEIKGQEHAVTIIENYISENLDTKEYKMPEPETKSVDEPKVVEADYTGTKKKVIKGDRK